MKLQNISIVILWKLPNYCYFPLVFHLCFRLKLFELPRILSTTFLPHLWSFSFFIHCIVFHLIIFVYMFLGAFSLFCYPLMNTQSHLLGHICMFLGYRLDKKKNIIFWSKNWLIRYFLAYSLFRNYPFYSASNTVFFWVSWSNFHSIYSPMI